ncbi:Wzz/FepE/Etk N-terminal domain-containing protein [Methyloceanibacter sp. wino2]|uniref:Wzz/FepE/Etk N-terminal domain-containing protein n=1 Tax=Methyloceanibacter sp. wino2 TaxID=2170729 RepID=UPI000D3E1FBA|nr:Wzz/FepE/Etk N-terminal domain-containing protein [Methyloceanibacter sp. wino2]
MTNSSSVPPADDIDLGSLGAALWRAKGRIIALSLLAGAITFIALSMMRPLYTSEARILVQNEETAFTRPTNEQSTSNYRVTLDEQAVQSQVQVLNSRDLILQVVRDLDLTQNAAFLRDAGGSPIARLLRAIGLGGSTQESLEERAANAVAEHLDVFQLSNSSVIAIEYSSGDPQLAAQVANKLADVYIGWQRDAKIEQTKDATAWLDAQIKALRKATAESEAAVETFKASEGLYAGSNNITLNAQQLSELNSQLILAEAQESEAQARAKLIKKMLATNGDIDATPEVLNSQLVINLIEQRVLVQRQLAELSATLLPSHPRIQQLRSELADVRAQIRSEAKKVVQSLENQAQIAAAREASLRASLDAAKSRTSGQSEAEVKLRALEREAKANRDLLESYLARYRDASARHDVGAVPAQAAIVSRAHASVLPSFPRRGPITLLVIAATALLSIGTVLAKTIIVSGAPQRQERPSDFYGEEAEELVPSEPEYMSRAEMLALSRMNAQRQKPAQPQPAPPKPSQDKPAGTTAKPIIENRRMSETRGKPKAKQRPSQPQQGSPKQQTPNGPQATAKPAEAVAPKQPEPASEVAPAAAQKAAAETKPDRVEKSAETPKPADSPNKRQRSVWRASKPAKRPSWLAVSEPRSATLDTPEEATPVAAEADAPSSDDQAQLTETAPTKKVELQTASADETPERAEAPTEEGDSKSAGVLAALAAPAAAIAAKAAMSEPEKRSIPDEEPAADKPSGEEAEDSAGSKPAQPASPSTDFVQRMRRDAIKRSEAEETATSAKRRAAGLFGRLRGKPTKEKTTGAAEESALTAKAAQDAGAPQYENESEMAALSPNDLRHYLTQRIAASDENEELETEPVAEPDVEALGPVMGSLHEVVGTVLKSSTGGLPRALLVAGTSARSPSPQAAIGIARDLASRNEQVALVDLAKGAAVVSGRLNLPRVPGFSDLAVGAVDFADVVNLDDGSTLQVIPAGNPTLSDGYDAPDKFMRVFEALTQTYDCVVLHADMAAIDSLMPALKFELPVAVAVLPPRTTPEEERDPLSVIQRLGCPIVVHGTPMKHRQRRFSLFGRKVAV